METLFIGKNIIFLPEVDSTNSYATHLLKNVNLAEGTVIHAAHQTQGKGQRGARWNADPQRNLTASFILKPVFLDIADQFFLYQVAALACYDALAEIVTNGGINSQIDIKIKWPNDILLNGRKIAGILIENIIQNGRIAWSVVGIGINVNQQHFDEALRATSLTLLSGKEQDVKDTLACLCRHFEKHYLALLNKKNAAIEENYLNRLFGLNQRMRFEWKGKPETFLVKGVGKTGLLLLEDSHGEELEVDVKEVKWLY